MKNLCRLLLVLPFLLFACASADTKPTEAPPAAVAPPPAPLPDSISGRVVSDDALSVMPPHIEVRLHYGSKELGRQAVDADGKYRFEGPLEKGRYELTAHAGALHGSRAITCAGGEMKDISVVIAKTEPRRHRRRRHRD
ncbi:MAG: carboxypeptidase-like regulatory domain-containing protein [Bdellovibrionota bacterium]